MAYFMLNTICQIINFGHVLVSCMSLSYYKLLIYNFAYCYHTCMFFNFLKKEKVEMDLLLFTQNVESAFLKKEILFANSPKY